MRILKPALQYLLGLLLIVAGCSHFLNSDFFVSIMPPYLPWHLFLVYLSGIFEIALGILLLVPAFTQIAAWGLIALFIAVFPANIHMALHSELYPTLSPIALWVRLPFQAVLIAWAYWYTRSPER